MGTAGDIWSEWLLNQRFAHLSETERADTLRALRFFRDTTLEHADVHPGQTLIDLGAGTGLLAQRAAELVGPQGRVIAIDVSQKSLRELDHRDSPGPLLRIAADARTVPVGASSADRVVMRSVLIYIEAVEQVLRECARVLRPDGRVAICEPLNARRYNTVSLEDASPELRAALQGMQAAKQAAASPMARMAPDYLTACATAAGFDVIHSVVIDDVEQLADADAVERYVCRVSAPGRPTIAQQYEQALGSTAWGELHQRWLEHARQRPFEWRTPMLYLAAVPRR